MDILNTDLLCKIEEALDIEFCNWQVDYILDRPQILNMRITGRKTGKTTVYIIKLLFQEDKPIRAYERTEVTQYSDWFCISDRQERADNHYTEFFRRYLIDIYEKLIEKGLNPRPIFFSRDEERQFYNQKREVSAYEEKRPYKGLRNRGI